MDTHVAPVGWSDSPTPNPATANATSGWREFGSMDMAGDPLDVRSRVGGYVLTAPEAVPLMDRASIFSAFNGGEGWNPMP